MKIGIDLDGTAWDNRELFKELILALKSRGHEIQILTSHISLLDADMKLWRARGFPRVDGYICKSGGEEKVPSREWKINAAKKFQLDYILDDFDTGEIRLIKINEKIS